MHSSSFQERLQILTLAPNSWSRREMAEFFNVSEYLIRTARSMKEEKGTVAIPEAKREKKLTKETEELVKVFFKDDEYSRMLLGKKDYVSIATNIHKHKRLFLCNMNELYVAFTKNPTKTQVVYHRWSPGYTFGVCMLLSSHC